MFCLAARELCGSLIKQACLLARARSMWYMPMRIAACTSYVVACIVLLYMKIFVYFIKIACLLAIISKFGGGGDNSILWLSFAQQKH
jgi:hypothetical protein